jgi:AcrR family transcriptional regulator
MEHVESAIERGGTSNSCRPNVLAGELFPEPPRQERSRRAHEALVAAALSRFAETGYEATSIDDIATQAGVAVGAFYLHFRSKRQVLLVLLDRLLTEFDSWPALAPDAGAATVIERIRHYFDQGWIFAGVYRAWREAALRDTSLEHLDARLEAWSTARCAGLLEHAAARPGGRPSVDIPTLAGMLSVIFWRSLDTPVAAREALSATVAAVVTHALFEDGAGAESR